MRKQCYTKPPMYGTFPMQQRVYRNTAEEIQQQPFPSTYYSHQIQNTGINRPPEGQPQPFNPYPISASAPIAYQQPSIGMYAPPYGGGGMTNPNYAMQNFSPGVQAPMPTSNSQQPYTPYPVSGKKKQQEKSGVGSFMNQFKTNDGSSYDVNKMMSTAGQMINTVNQFTGMFKSFGSFIK